MRSSAEASTLPHVASRVQFRPCGLRYEILLRIDQDAQPDDDCNAPPAAAAPDAEPLDPNPAEWGRFNISNIVRLFRVGSVANIKQSLRKLHVRW